MTITATAQPKVVDLWPMSPLQQGLFYPARRADGVDPYVVQLAVDIDGELDIDRLRSAATALVDRHAALRGAFRQRASGEPVVMVVDRVAPDVDVVDLRDAADPQASWTAIVDADHRRGFAVGRPPLVRFTVAVLGAGRHRLLITNHHLIWDGWSTPIVVGDLFRLYAGEELTAAPSYRSFLGWLASADASALDRWADHLEGLPAPSRVAESRGEGEPAVIRERLDVATHSRLTALARTAGVTLNTVVQSAWALVVSALTGADDVVFGAVVSGRPADLADVESTVGLFINTVPVRVRLDPSETIRSLLRAVAAAQAGLLDAHHVALHDIAARVGLGELFDSLVVFENYPLDETALTALGDAAGLGLSITPGRNQTDYPLVLTVTPEPTGELDLALEIDPDAGVVAAHAPAVLSEILRVFTDDADTPLARIGARPHPVTTLPVPTAPITDVPVPVDLPTLVDLPAVVDDVFASARAVAAGTPDTVAVEGPDGVLTNSELWSQVDDLAARLGAEGAGPDVPVAVALDRRAGLVTALLAVIRAGAVPMPVDPEYPADRIALMIGDGRPAVAIVCAATAHLVAGSGVAIVDLDTPTGAAVPAVAELLRPRPDHGAYLLFTSGSTGRPKPVLATQRGLATRLAWDMGTGSTGAVRIAKGSPSFVDGLTEILLAVATSTPLVIADDAARRSPATLASLLGDAPVDRFGAVPVLLDELAGELSAGARPDLWVSSGEALRTDVAARLLAVDPDVRLVNSYGSSEVVGDVTVYAVDAASLGSGGTVPIGFPVPGTRVAVLDGWLRPVVDGVVGELYVAGPQLARGYPGAPGLTAARFVADPAGSGLRLYRTGDLVHRDRDGALVFDGRADGQLSVRGFRVEPGEVEATLVSLPGVTAAAVAVVSVGGSDALAAFVVPDPLVIDPFDAGDLRRQLGALLPGHLVPTILTAVDEIPLSPNGKTDRRALAALDVLARTSDPRPPATAVEEAVAAAVADILGVDAPGMDDDLLALGGHSLTAARLGARLARELGVTVGIRDVFDRPVLGDLAERVSELLATGAGRIGVIPLAERPDRPRLSAAQERMWFLHELDGPDAVLTIRLAVAVPGVVDDRALRSAFGDVLGRHEVLRTIYASADDGPWQRVLDLDEIAVDIAVVDVPIADPAVADLAAGDTPAGVAVAEVGATAFEISSEIPIRMTLVRGADGHSVIVVAVHHIAADEWSAPVLFGDLSTAYEARLGGRAPAWRPLPVQYVDYAAVTAPDDALARWTTRLDGIPDEMPTPRDRPRPSEPDQRGASLSFVVDAAQTGRLRALARRSGASMFVLSHVVTAVALAQLGAGDDIVLGTPVAGRTDDAVSDLVGLFVNTLVLRTPVPASASLGELVTAVRDIDLDALADQETPFERLVDEMAPTRSLSRHPLFQNMVAYRAPGRPPRFAGLPTTAVDHPADRVQFDLSTLVLDDGRRLTVRIDYAVELFDAATVERIAATWRTVARALATDASTTVRELPAVTGVDADLVTRTWAHGPASVAPPTLAGMLDDRAADTPHATAVVALGTGRANTYADIAREVNRLARHLITVGVGPEDRIVVAADRSAEMVVAIWAVVASGAAFVPVDLAQGPDRLAAIIAVAEPALILTDRADLGGGAVRVISLSDTPLGRYSDGPVTDADRRGPIRGDHTAYVTFTSGSTGVPKGVAVPHDAIANTVVWREHTFALGAGGRLLQKTSPAFDPFIPEILWPLAVGGTLVLPPAGAERDARELGAIIVDHDIAFVELVPSMIAAMLDEGVRLVGARRRLELSAGGEALRPDLVAGVASEWDVHLWNTYGPAEAAVEMTAADLDGHRGGPVTIGTPIPGARVHVLDASLRPVAPGVVGELYIGGRPLARGYLGASAQTAMRFVADPYATGVEGARLYRTGDLVRWSHDGLLEFFGRNDFQLKLRGMRVEPGEVENLLTAVDGVRGAVATTAGSGAATRLVAYVATDGTDGASVLAALRATAAPAHLIPASIHVVDAFSYSASGKIDRRALPDFDDSGATATGGAAPGDGAQIAVADAMGEVLETPVQSLDDDFFALGGHSLVATRLVSAIARRTGRRLTVRDVFEHPTVAGLAALVAEEVTGGRIDDTTSTGPMPTGRAITRAPATPGQTSLWLLAQMDSGAAYENHGVWNVEGRLDVATLTVAVADVLERHDVLRTVLEWDGEHLWQHLAPPADVVSVVEIADDALEAEIDALRAERTDLATDLPIRVRLLRTPSGDVLVVSVHHAVTDETSTPLIYTDLGQAYGARAGGIAPAWGPRPAQYAEYALWQRDRQATTAAADLAAAAAALDSYPLVADLPYVSDRRDGAVVYRSARLAAPTVDRVRSVAASVRTTPLMVLQYAVSAALSAVGAGDRIVLGTPVTLRDDEAFADTVGYFVNTVVLCSDLSDRPSFLAAADRLRTETLGVLDRRHVPFGDLVDAVNPPRPEGVSPIFQVMIAHLDDSSSPDVAIGPHALTPLTDVRREAIADLVASLSEQPDGGWEIGVDVPEGLFADETVDTIVGVAAALVGLIGYDGDLPLDRSVRLARALVEAEGPAVGHRSAPVVGDGGPFSAHHTVDRASGARVGDVLQALIGIIGLLESPSETEGPGLGRADRATRRLDRIAVHRSPAEFDADVRRGSGGARLLADDGIVTRLDLLDAGEDPLRLDAAAAAIGIALDDPTLRVRLGSAEDWWAAQRSRADSDEMVDGGHWIDFAEAAMDADEPGPSARGPVRVRHARVDRAAPGRVVAAAVIATVDALRDSGVDLGDVPVVEVEETARVDDASAFVPGVLTWRYPVIVDSGEPAGIELPEPSEVGDHTLLERYSVHAQGLFADVPDAAVLVRVHRTDTSIRGRGDCALGAHRAVVAVTSARDGSSTHVAIVHDYDVDVDADAVVEAIVDASPPSGVELDLLSAARSRTESAGGELVTLPAADRARLTADLGPLTDVWPLTALQEGLLYHLRVAGDAGEADLYASQSVATVRGRLDVDAMSTAITAIMRRHPSLRAAFVTVAGRSVAAIAESVDVPISVYTPDDVAARGIEAILAGERFAPFHPERPPLIRFALVPTGQDRWLIVFSFEHVLMDGWSIGRLLDDLFALYAGEVVDEPASMRSYLDWLAGRDESLHTSTGARTESAPAAWRRYLAGVDEPTILYPAAASTQPDALLAADHHRTLNVELSDQVRRSAGAAGVTVGTFLQTAWGVTLGRLTGRTDVVFGTTVAGRPADLDDAERIVGLLFNTVPVRVNLAGVRTVADQVRDQQQSWIEVLDAGHVGLTRIADDAGVPSLFDTLFILQNVPASVEGRTFAGLEVESRSVNDATHYPVSFAADPAERIVVRCAYRSDVLDAEAARVLTDRYVAVLMAMADDLDAPVARIGVATDTERELTLRTWNSTACPIPDMTIADLFADQVRRTPDAPALIAGATVLTFAQLSAEVNRLARVLISRGAGPERRVVLLLPRDERMVIAMFACFAAGAAYVPVDADYPADRVAYMIATADPEVVVGVGALLPDGPLRDGGADAGTRVVDLDDPAIVTELDGTATGDLTAAEAPRASGDNLAYVIYTSGSTGRPKGVAVGYRGLTNMLVNHRVKIFDRVVAEQGGRRMRIAHTTSFSFDASWEQLFWMLDGHTVDVVDEELRKDPPALLDYYDAASVDGFDVTPSYGQVLLDAGLLDRPRSAGLSTDADDAGVVFVSLGGEAVPEAVWTALRQAPGVSGYNLYGPTEYTINALGADLADSATSCVGEPIYNTRAYVLDAGLSPVPPNTPGELYLAGAGVARGYLGQPGLTSERFVACPWGLGERMYRTGDIARWRDDGTLDYLGRGDAQVKIRGFRIEPAEIADAIAACDGVGRAAVRVVTSPSGMPALVGYAVPEGERRAGEVGEEGLDPVAIRDSLRRTLPEYMVPAVVGVIDDLPLTVNGKLDVAALPDIPLATEAVVAPVGPVEEFVCAVFADLIGLTEISVTADVFDSGGNSLIAMKAVARLNDGDHGFAIRVRDVFAAPTPRALAALVSSSTPRRDSAEPMHPALVEFVGSTSGRRVICFHEAFGFAAAYSALVDHMPPGWGLIGVGDVCEVPGTVEPARFDDLVMLYADAVRSAQRSGPYDLLGWSYGGHLAFAVARELVGRGEEVASLTIIDAYAVALSETEHVDVAESRRRVRAIVGAAPEVSDIEVVRAALAGSPLAGLTDAELASSFDSHARCERMLAQATSGVVDVPTTLVYSTTVYSTAEAESEVSVESTWAAHLSGPLEVVGVAASHDQLVTASVVDEWIAAARGLWTRGSGPSGRHDR